MQTIFERFYDEQSARDVSSLFSLKTILNSKQVHKDTKKDYWATSLFLDKVLDGHLLYAALRSLKLKSLDDRDREFTTDEGMISISKSSEK